MIHFGNPSSESLVVPQHCRMDRVLVGSFGAFQPLGDFAPEAETLVKVRMPDETGSERDQPNQAKKESYLVCIVSGCSGGRSEVRESS